MKPIPISQSPTRSRALNVFLGMILTLGSILVFLALATYRPTDPSFDTASGGNIAVGNWIGLFGAGLSACNKNQDAAGGASNPSSAQQSSPATAGPGYGSSSSGGSSSSSGGAGGASSSGG